MVDPHFARYQKIVEDAQARLGRELTRDETRECLAQLDREVSAAAELGDLGDLAATDGDLEQADLVDLARLESMPLDALEQRLVDVEDFEDEP